MRYYKISPSDNVGVITEDSLIGHKIALEDIKKGEPIIKYGHKIGIAKSDIKMGEIVHSNNLETALNDISEFCYKEFKSIKKEVSSSDSFYGYLRDNGKAGIRNEIWVIPTVGCISKVAQDIALRAKESVNDLCDGVFALTHPYGCSQLGDDLINTQKILSGLIKHPNAGGVLVVGLGCENNRIDELKKALGSFNADRIRFLECQNVIDEVGFGVGIIKELAELIKGDKKTELPISKLIVGLKCGGSDGFSGITANPLVGRFADKLIDAGGTAILAEVPEMFGAEEILLNRCVNKEVFDKAVNMINGFKRYYLDNDQPIYENPSPGNKDGGITTLEEKSIGCVQKGGNSNIVDVLNLSHLHSFHFAIQ